MASRFRYGGRLLAAATVTALLGSGTAFALPAKSEPQFRLVRASTSVILDRWEEEGVYLDLGTHVVAGKNPFEIWAKRATYKDPVVATQVIRTGGSKRRVPLPAGVVTDFTGFRDFTHVTIKNAAGKKVFERDDDFCPNSYSSARTRPDAPDKSPYPMGCPSNPFTLGSVWGIQAGWSAATSEAWEGGPVDLPVGNYTATVTLNKTYRELFKIPTTQSSATVKVTVRTPPDDCGMPQGAAKVGPTGCLRAGTAQSHRAKPTSPVPQPAAIRPTGKPRIPKGPKPDLRSLPAWGIQLTDDWDREGVRAKTPAQYLAFNATVWTAGTSPLVVDGFRRSGEDVMDAYQYFFDSKGKQVGYAPVGEMEWDARDGHEHWHFRDFAQYRLLDASKKVAVRSGKEAFCLANTDAVDYTIPNANWRPEGTDLHTACGDKSSLAVREVLDIGSGDTYAQYLPGQSFDITTLPNGAYYIEVAANPDHRLYESDTTNNVSYRKVILGGTPEARTVTVPPYDGIDA
ncbi:lysyl oxidase family protein [Actinopolymorpha alba]|uniref:lysyl oxidase family protein n=1 Tax=Actinopolymorpha alba TaxID=533267 RepID=UPI00037E524A|nr:lysyl oxidase family protein [Actinopolymorpha alba]